MLPLVVDDDRQVDVALLVTLPGGQRPAEQHGEHSLVRTEAPEGRSRRPDWASVGSVASDPTPAS